MCIVPDACLLHVWQLVQNWKPLSAGHKYGPGQNYRSLLCYETRPNNGSSTRNPIRNKIIPFFCMGCHWLFRISIISFWRASYLKVFTIALGNNTSGNVLYYASNAQSTWRRSGEQRLWSKTLAHKRTSRFEFLGLSASERILTNFGRARWNFTPPRTTNPRLSDVITRFSLLSSPLVRFSLFRNQKSSWPASVELGTMEVLYTDALRVAVPVC